MAKQTYYSPEDIAEILSLKPNTIRTWLRQGELRGIKLAGRIWRVSEEELDRFMQAGLEAADREREGA